MSADIKEALFQIISEQLNVKTDQLNLSNHFINDLKADSLDVVELIMSVEEKWNLSIPDEKADKMETIQNLLDYIKTQV